MHNGWSQQPRHQLLLFPQQHEIQLFGDPVTGYSLLTPFVDTAGVLPKKPQMAEENEKMYGLKIRMRQFADRAIAFNKGVPKRVLLLLEQNTSMEKCREIVCQKSGTAIIEIEEHRLSGVGSLQCNVGVIPVAITVAARPGKSVPFCQRTGQSRCQINKPCAYGVAEILKRQYIG